MNNINNLMELNLNNTKELDKGLELQISKNKNELQNIVDNILDKGADYIIKATPINDHIKDILIDVKNSFKTKGFKEILKTVINSSVREGIEIINLPKNVLKDIKQVKDAALNGGLVPCINAGLDILYKNNFKNHLFSDYIGKFFKDIKTFISSKTFYDKFEKSFIKLGEKVTDFKKLCDNWYKAYEKFDIDSINAIAKELTSKGRKVVSNVDCIKENQIIQNMTQLINNKNSKLSPMQLQICNNL